MCSGSSTTYNQQHGWKTPNPAGNRLYPNVLRHWSRTRGTGGGAGAAAAGEGRGRGREARPDEAANYVAALQMQVNMMHALAGARESALLSSSEADVEEVQAEMESSGDEEMDASMSASFGTMGSLIGKLDVMLLEAPQDDPGDHRRGLRIPKGFKKGIHLLKEEIEEISTYLEDLSEVEDCPLTVKCWMKEVRELSYDIEDYIDSLTWPGPSSNIKTRSIRKISHVKLTRFPRKKKLTYFKCLADKISEFRFRAQDANERYKRYELNCHNLRRRSVPVGPMLPTPYQEGADLVIDGQLSHLIGTLDSNRDLQLKVVSVVGSGGIGKTTLVRVLYNKIRDQFNCRAFVRITRKPDMSKILRDMLTQVQWNQRYDDCDDLDLMGRIRKLLQDKRYLIIIDDLWAVSVWNIINHAFPQGSQCSRIIITTQIEEIALTCCGYRSEFILEMRPLDSYHSKKLFFHKIFGSESDCPDTFKEVSNKIIELCGGLPLATIGMASLLASHPVILIEQWTYVSDSLSSNLRTSSISEGVRLVLNLSYNNLTRNLKTCLLYLNMYPEGYTICKDDLVRQWVAEGFINATEGQDAERVAWSYFDELIDRRFLQPASKKCSNEIMSCTVHDIVHDLIAYKSAEENFVVVLDNYRKNIELCNKVHRLSLQFGDTKYEKKPGNIRTSQVRSFTFFGLFTSMPSITEFKLLRVINLQLSSHQGKDILNLTGISELFHLRYFKVASDVCVELPKHMQGLRYLETLDMDTKVTDVPWDIIHLPCLLHLHLPFETNLMDRIGSTRSANLQKLDKLTNLRDLRLTCSTAPSSDHLKQNMEALGSFLAGLGNLKTLAVVPGSSLGNGVIRAPSKVTISWDGFAPPLLLQRFECSPCSCTFSGVPKWIGEFGNLSVLRIAVKALLRDGVDILKGLPALTTLSLYVHSAPVERIVFDKAGFLVLKYFKFRCRASWLKFEADAMPNLCKLKLGFNSHRVDQHDSTRISIEHLPGLKEISVKIGGAGADAESALMSSVINHPSNPQIKMQLVDWIFYGDKIRNTASGKEEHEPPINEIAQTCSRKGKKEHETVEQHVIMKETGGDISMENVDRKTKEKEQGRIEHHVIMLDTKYLVSGKDQDESEQIRDTKRETIEQQDGVMEDEVIRENENKRTLISNVTPPVPASHLPFLDIEQILKEAQHRWLRPAEICEILKNYRNFQIAPEPPNRPPSGSLFLFDRKVLRYFRKDGHNWRKKNDQKTVKEARETLKSGGVDVLHCYYAHGEENINFQRRTYWMLEEDYMHIALLHYLETKGGKSRARRNKNMIQTDLASWNTVIELDNGPVQMPPLQFPVPPEQGNSTENLGVDYLTSDEVYSDGLCLKDIGAPGAGDSFWQSSKTLSSNLSDILEDSFKKTDGFTKWMSKELLEVEGSQIESSSGVYWSIEEADSIIVASSCEPLDQFTVSPMLSQDQLFSIVDFAPSWTYVGSKTKILVTGNILNNSQVTERCKWSCMFGEVEVPAKLLADGTLICYSPRHKSGRVPFYVTCSNRLACSEVREFEFRPTVSQYMDAPSPHGPTNKVYFQIRLDELLFLGQDEYQATVSNPSPEMVDLSKKISSLMMSNDEWSNLLKLAVDNEPSTDDQQDQFAENLIKEKLHVWLLNKVGVGGKGPSVLDDEGQGVLHLAAALGYDWAIRPTLAAGVNINFRDVHGWTALHWAAFCGRERTVVALIALGAAPGALTDPTPDFPGITPADLASANSQRGISGFLAESSSGPQSERS
ncbi:hypothetical protein U9M48_019455 [Paspalum notatum var. saurae]|uniref:CG-1 domain-containing protein n=1 Tax=Paspalum notatum var. saurae TaxID=547442 RepID=A0AAQ3TCC5_PASNO